MFDGGSRPFYDVISDFNSNIVFLDKLNYKKLKYLLCLELNNI